jgi:hypothetical protein
MHAELNESSLMSLAELLNRWKETRAASDLTTALETIVATMRRGDQATAEVMCCAVRAVTGIVVRIAEPHAWAASRLH